MEVVCSRCRSVLASGAGLADAAVLNGSVMGSPTLPVGVLVEDPAAVAVQVYERGRPMSEVEQAPAHSVVVRPDSVSRSTRSPEATANSTLGRSTCTDPRSWLVPVTFRDIQPEPVREIYS